MNYSEFLKTLCSGRRFYFKEGGHIVECVPTMLSVHDYSIELLGHRPDCKDEFVLLVDDDRRIDLGETAEKCAAGDCHSLCRDLVVGQGALNELGINVHMEHGAFKRYMWDGFMPVPVRCTPYLEYVSERTIRFRMNQKPERSRNHADRLIAVDIATGEVTFNDGLYATREECSDANSINVIDFDSWRKLDVESAGDAETDTETDIKSDIEPDNGADRDAGSVGTPCAPPVSQTVETLFNGILPILKAFSTLLVSHGLKDYTYIGSCALLAAGFPLVREPHDIDVEVLCEKDADALFAKMREIERAEGRDDDGYNGQDKGRRAFFKFRFAGRTFNVWTTSPEKGFTDSRRFMSEGLWFGGVGDVLEAKAGYGRDKDRADTYGVIRTLAGLFGLHTHSDGSGMFIGNPDHKDGKEACDGAEG